MSPDIAAIVERARLAAGDRPDAANAGEERARLQRIAQEFEAMLLVQVLRDMRSSGAWEEQDQNEGLGMETMAETIDVELASHLARVQGLGLSTQMLAAFDRMAPAARRPADGAHGAEARGHGEDVGHSAGSHLAAAPQPAAYAGGAVPAVDPLDETPSIGPLAGDVTSPFGWRHDPFTGQTRFHRGVDLRAAYGEEVSAAGAGRVVFSGSQGGYGTTVVIEHADGTRTRYAHLSVALVGAGDPVAPGQAVGRAGRSGRATGTHVHFELLSADGRPLDPAAVRAPRQSIYGEPASGE